jgi:hypothetical protein
MRIKLGDKAMRHEIPLQAGIDAPSKIDEKQFKELKSNFNHKTY